MTTAQTRSCALPMDGLNACPPGASCFTCSHYREGERGSPEEQRAARLEERAHVRARIVDALATLPGGLTSAEVASAAGLNEATARGRLSELEREGVVRRLNRRRRNPETGRRASLYVVTEPRPVAP